MPLPTVHLSGDHPRPLVSARVRAGDWTQVRPGAYMDAAALVDAAASAGVAEPTDPARRRMLALARIVALREQLSLPYSLSHQSAALLWGLPLLHVPAQTHVIQRSKPTRRGASDIVRHVHRLPADQRTVHRGHPTTTLERTIVDCCLSLSPLAGLVVADAGLHIGADRARCLEIVTALTGHRGSAAARALLDLADGGAESPGETATRFTLLRAGLPVPQTQVPVETRFGTYWADLGWPEWELLAEYDGRAKYGSATAPAGGVIAEKRRQAALEEAGWRVIRLLKEDLRDPDALVRRIARLAPAGAVASLRRRPLLAA